MEITLGHKIRLNPNKKQVEYFNKACGTARFTYNWGLAEWKRQYEAGLKPSGLALKKDFNAIKKEQFPWTYEVTKYASQQPFIQLQTAFVKFFKGDAEYPVFKKKGIHDSFYIGNDQFRIEGKKIKIPNLGWVRMAECLGCNGKIQNAVVSRTAGKWFVSINILMNITPASCENQAIAGVDLGIKNLAALSSGETIEGPKAYRKLQKKLKRLQQSFSRKQKGSKNREKQKRKIASLHYRISCIRMDSLHKLTTRLANDYSVIVIEDLNVKGMMSNGKLAKAIADMGFNEFRRQLAYKAVISSAHVIVADRWFPSSKRCSACGEKHKELKLSDRIFKCPSCFFTIDRDLNAAINLKQYPQLMAA